MPADNLRLTDIDRANLVAYLDGELDEASAQALAAKVTNSVSGRREVESLQKTWEMLDHLPRPSAPEDFMSRTLTEVQKLGLKGTELASAAGRTARQAVRIAAGAAVVLLTIGLGYALARWAWPDPTARLAAELSLAEHYEEYREVGSFEFLKALEESPAFDEALR